VRFLIGIIITVGDLPGFLVASSSDSVFYAPVVSMSVSIVLPGEKM
jgi:hypothetical protein